MTQDIYTDIGSTAVKTLLLFHSGRFFYVFPLFLYFANVSKLENAAYMRTGNDTDSDTGAHLLYDYNNVRQTCLSDVCSGGAIW